MLVCYFLLAGNYVHILRLIAVVPSDFTWLRICSSCRPYLFQELQIFCPDQSNEPWDVHRCLTLNFLTISRTTSQRSRLLRESSTEWKLNLPYSQLLMCFEKLCFYFTDRYEFKSNHGEWIAKAKPQLTCTVETRIQRAVFTPSSEALRFIGVKVREELQIVMDTLLKDDAVLVVPVLHCLLPKLDASADELEVFEYQTHAFMSFATISGCCQVVIPVGSYGCPLSVSLLARKGADLLLLETVFLLHTTCQQEVLFTANLNLPITAFVDQIRS